MNARCTRLQEQKRTAQHAQQVQYDEEDDDAADNGPHVEKCGLERAVAVIARRCANHVSPNARTSALLAHNLRVVDLVLNLLEGAAQQARHLDLGDTKLLGDLDLRHSLQEPQVDDLALARGEPP